MLYNRISWTDQEVKNDPAHAINYKLLNSVREKSGLLPELTVHQRGVGFHTMICDQTNNHFLSPIIGFTSDGSEQPQNAATLVNRVPQFNALK